MEASRAWSWPSTGAMICAKFLPKHEDSLAHVARLIDEFLVDSLDDQVLTSACEYGASPSDLDFLLSRTVPDWRKVVTSAAKGGHLDVFRWMMELQDTRGPWERDFFYAMEEAARYGHLKIIERLLERGFRSGLALMQAIRNGHLAVVKRLLQEGFQLSGWEHEGLKGAALNGHLETVQWIHENFQYVDTSYALEGAARKGDLETVQWLHPQLKPCLGACALYIMDAAVHGGHFHVVEWLFENCSKGCSNLAAPKTAQAGDLPMLQWLHQHYRDRFDSDIMDMAAWEGHLEVVKWLHDLGSERCTTSFAMDAAAGNGHLDVVRWLHENRTEGCTTEAMDYAARSGHLHIVKWLHENRSEGCTESAMRDAAVNGHLDVLRWLVEHYPDKCRDDLMEIAAWEGHLDVVRYLDKSTVQRASKWRLSAAASQGRLKALQVLIQNYYHRDDGTMGWHGLNAVCKAFDKVLAQLTSQHATPASSLWTEALDSLERFHRCGFHSSVSLMLERALKRGFLPIVQQFMGDRDVEEKRKYVAVAAKSWNVVVLRWLLRSGTPIDRSAAIELATKKCAIAQFDYVEVAGYLSEGDRVQLICEAVMKDKWRKLLWWMLKNTRFNDETSRTTICSAVKQAPREAVKWLRENLTSAEAREWCV